MTEPTLQQVFGENSSQDADSITISKSDLAGLTALANNTPESLLVAIILKAGQYLTAANRQDNPEQDIVIGEFSESITTEYINNAAVRFSVVTVPIELYDELESVVVDPMKY